MCELSQRQLLLVAFFLCMTNISVIYLHAYFFCLKLDIFNVYCGKSGTQTLPCPLDLLLLLTVVILVCLVTSLNHFCKFCVLCCA